MDLIIVTIALVVVVALYFRNNPLGHSSKFMWHRFVNWFALGMTYGFLYRKLQGRAVAIVGADQIQIPAANLTPTNFPIYEDPAKLRDKSCHRRWQRASTLETDSYPIMVPATLRMPRRPR